MQSETKRKPKTSIKKIAENSFKSRQRVMDRGILVIKYLRRHTHAEKKSHRKKIKKEYEKKS